MIIQRRTIDIADRNRRLLRLLSPLLLLGAVALAVLAAAALVAYGVGSILWMAYRVLSWPVYWLLEWALTGLRRLVHGSAQS